nr:FAD-dependent monooxygenase [Rappaport israeli]
MSQQTDILIVGAGPAGLSISRALANSTLRLTIIDPQSAETLANPPFDGREIALTHPSKNLLETLDIWQRIPKDQIHPLRQAKVQNGNTPPQLHFPTPKNQPQRPTHRHPRLSRQQPPHPPKRLPSLPTPTKPPLAPTR